MTTLSLDDILSRFLPDLSDAELAIAVAFINAIKTQCEAKNIPITASIVLRVKDVLITELIAQKLEGVLWKDGIQPEQKPQADKPAPQKIALHPAIEQLGKTRDRLRKGLHELDRALVPSAPSTATTAAAQNKKDDPLRQKGIADWYMEEFAEFEGIIEETREELRRRQEAGEMPSETDERTLDEIINAGAPIPPHLLSLARNGSG